MTKHGITLLLFLAPFFATNAQNEAPRAPDGFTTDTVKDCWDDQYVFIRYDSIPALLVDSVIDFSGNKIAAKDLRRSAWLYEYALTPSYPLNIKQIRWDQIEPKLKKRKQVTFFKTGGGLIPHGINYIAKIKGKEVTIDSPEKFRKLFAPVETIQEAIAFAALFTDSYPMYDLDFLVDPVPPEEPWIPFNIDSITGDTIYNIKMIRPLKEVNWIIYTSEIISSYALQTADGYELLLYHYKVFGCSHPYIRRRIKVTFDGMVEILDEQDAFQDLDDDGLCID